MKLTKINRITIKDIIDEIDKKTISEWEHENGGSEISDRIMKTLSKM